MQLSLDQVQIQTQKLIMTPQMQLSIKLLQMNTLELEQLAQQEMLENPFLEIDEEGEEEEEQVAGERKDDRADAGDAAAEPAPTGEERKGAEKISEPVAASDSPDDAGPERASLDSNEGAETFQEVDVAWDDYYEESRPRLPSTREAPGEERDFTEYTASRESLYDHLLWQLRVSSLDDKGREIGEFLIGNIDDNGYLKTTVEETAQACAVAAEEVERVLSVVQSFDPTGVGARDLAECLLLQLDDRDLMDPIYAAILTKHFVHLAQQKFEEIARDVGVEEEKVIEALGEIRRCDPKPGRSISKEAPRYVEPDIYVKTIDGRNLYFLNEGDLRHLHVNKYYRNLLQAKDGLAQNEKKYYREKYRSAVWLIRNIERRKGTVLRVTEAIMEFQKEFLEKGTQFLRPLTLRQIAEKVGMHEATIARVTANKYVDTPRGVFPLKYFFSSGLDRSDGSTASSRSVKELIRKLIDEENPRKPLSDSAIAKMLKERGLKIARRTVAKYRDSLKILPANLRRKVSKS